MNLETILINTYSPNPDLRKSAESMLQEFQRTPGSFTVTLQFIASRQIHRDLRLAAMLALKNHLRDYWTESEALHMTQEEKDNCKVVVIDMILLEDDNNIKALLADTIRTICEFEYPQNWPDLVPKILSTISAFDNPSRIYNALLILRKLVKRYEFKATKDRHILDQIIHTSFPLLQNVIGALIENNSPEAAHVLRMCFKIFYSSTLYALPADGGGIDVNLWFNAFSHILQKELFEPGVEGPEGTIMPANIDERLHFHWWRTKKWASRIVVHFIQRYGNPKYCSENMEFANYFRANLAVTLLGPMMNCLALRVNNKYITTEVHRQAIVYLLAAVEMSPTYKAIKPHLDFVIFQVVFPVINMSDDEIQSFRDDPQEAIRKAQDDWAEILEPRSAATNLLKLLARYRGKDCLDRIMRFMLSSLAEYEASPPEMKNYRLKDTLLVAVRALYDVLKDHKTYSGHLQVLLARHIVPEFKSPLDFVRARSFWVIESFDSEFFEADTQLLETITRGLLDGLVDPSLPVQTAAACSINRLIETEGTKDLMRPGLQQIVAQYFRIMQETDSNTVMGALQSLVLAYQQEIAPLAGPMISHLIEFFYSLSQANTDEAAFSATSCLDTILAILEVCEELTEVMTSFEPLICPLISKLLIEDGMCFEYIEHAFSIMSFITYSGPTISPMSWSLLGPLLNAMHNWANGFMREASVPIFNYLNKDVGTMLLTHPNGDKSFVLTMLDTIKKALETEHDESIEVMSSLSLLMGLVVCCKCQNQSIDGIFGDLISMLLKRLANTTLSPPDEQFYKLDQRSQEKYQRRMESKLKQAFLRINEVILACLYYNPILTLEYLEQRGAPFGISLSSIFNNIFETVLLMTRNSSQRLVVLSFLELLRLPGQAMPEVIKSNLIAMFQQIIREVVLIEEEAARGLEDGDSFNFDDENDFEGFDLGEDGEDDEDDEDDTNGNVFAPAGKVKGKATHGETVGERLEKLKTPDGGYEEDDDCENVEDEEYIKMLKGMDKGKVIGGKKYRNGELVNGNDDDDDDDDDDEDEDYLLYVPIDKFDMSTYLTNTLMSINTAPGGPELASMLQAGLGSEDVSRLQEIMKTASDRKNNVGNN